MNLLVWIDCLCLRRKRSKNFNIQLIDTNYSITLANHTYAYANCCRRTTLHEASKPDLTISTELTIIYSSVTYTEPDN